MYEFLTDYKSILGQIETIDAASYSRSRNFLNGKVTMLSPYLTHGVITLNQIRTSLLKKYRYSMIEKLVFELAWKEYFLRVWENKKEEIWFDIKRPQDSSNELISTGIVDAKTGITVLDNTIKDLYNTGYMHNHARMWTASLVCNVANSHWLLPSKWMYYYLLDGDLATNTLSWQWVASTFSSKKYFVTQENINKYSGITQRNTFLDVGYDQIDSIDCPVELYELQTPELKCNLKKWVLEYFVKNKEKNLKPLLTYHLDEVKDEVKENFEEAVDGETALRIVDFDLQGDLLLFHPWMLNPNFGTKLTKAQKLLILEPSHFQKYPMSQKRIEFILDLAQNIIDLKVFVGEITDLPFSKFDSIVTQKYPAIRHWTNSIEALEVLEPDYMYPSVSGYFGSFMGYWKICEKLN